MVDELIRKILTNKPWIQTKNPDTGYVSGLLKVASTYSPIRERTVPSALAGLTSLFGMGRGGPRCYRHLKLADFWIQDNKLETSKVFGLMSMVFSLNS